MGKKRKKETLTRYAQARKRFKRAAEYDLADRKAAREDKRFFAGDQWDDLMRRDRESDARPVFTINLLPKFVRQITGEARVNQTNIGVLAMDGGADPSLAQVYEGLIRTIEVESDAETIYQASLDNAAQCGRGFFRIKTEYEHDSSFDQVIRMEPILDSLSVYFDPAAKRYDRSDAEFCFVTDWVPDEVFEATYGADALGFSDVGLDDEKEWQKDGGKRIAEYWYKEHREKTIWLLSTGEVVDADGIWTKDALEAAGWQVVDERKVDVVTVRRLVMGGGGFLDPIDQTAAEEDREGEEFPSRFIPIVPVMGPMVIVDGEPEWWSVIRWAKTPQQLYNIWTSTAAEKTSLAPKAPWLVTPKQIEGHENIWRDANQSAYAYLPYNPDPDAGGPPQRQFPEAVQQAELALRASAHEDMMNTTGLFQAGLGQGGPEVSGVAINARQSESDIGTIDWIKNLHQSIEYTGRILVDMIPRVYDTARAVQITGEDDATQFIMLNQVKVDPASGTQQIINDIRSGRYNVRISAGPGTKTAREFAATSLIQLMQAAPMQSQLILDKAVENLDFKGAQDVAKRIRMAMGFEVDPSKPPPGPPPEEVLKLQNQVAQLEGKQLANAKAQMEVAMKMEQYSKTGNPLILKDILATLQATVGRPGKGGGQGGGESPPQAPQGAPGGQF